LTVAEGWAEPMPCPGSSDIDLFGNGERIVHLYAEVPHCALDFGVTVQLLLGHARIESTVRSLGIEVDDALSIAEQIDV
jgi:hypothetical protein